MKTRIRELEQGGREIIRLISPDDLESKSKDDPLFFEKSIVWLENLDELPYVRVRTVRTARSRRGPLYLGGDDCRVVGYSKLTVDAPLNSDSTGYVRRVFYLRKSDSDDVAAIPSSAIDPRSIIPGVRGCPLSREVEDRRVAPTD
jgi:hypothetical protein